MKTFSLVMIFVFLFLSGCKNDEVVAPPNTERDGQIVLKIDRENAPQNVTTVTAYLTRSGYGTITGSLNLLSDTTADLNLNDIPVGTWHLKVDAADSANVVQYSGETDVTVLDNQTIQVTLHLVPVATGVGNIYLFVTWGTLPGNWIDYPGNPILNPIQNGYEVSGVYQGKVLYDDNKYKMWFNGLNPGGMGVIEYAESNNGVNWIRQINHPVLYPSMNGWDSESISLPVVIKVGDQFRMYYHGRASLNGPWHIGLATSSDGINWTKHTNPVLLAGTGWEYQVAPSDILIKDDVFYLFYCGIIYGSPVQHKIGLATSTDGVNFVRSSQNPVMIATQPWENGYVLYPSVIFENGQFKMVYANNNGTAFGEAQSSNGENWVKSPSNPFFRREDTSNDWASWIGYPYFRKFNDGYKIYYGGKSYSTYRFSIGLITK